MAFQLPKKYHVPEIARIPVRRTDMMHAALTGTPIAELLDRLADFALDPLGFVLWAFPWGEQGTALETEIGPEPWQREQLDRIGQRLRDGVDLSTGIFDGLPIEEDISSGHGVGKSAIVSWMILWAISTHEDTRGVVTANTDTQLRTKTWAELSKWYSLFIAKEFFTFTATSIYIAKDPVREKAWRIDAVPWSENNTEAFAGLHNKGKRIFVCFDEASTIADPVWEVTRGAITDAETQIIWCRYGNPTRTSGEFHKQCLAAGTPVLTSAGWLPIEEVPASVRVWDGVEWVAQDGAYQTAVSNTISVFNVEMTPDHLVLTSEGWRHGQACKEFDRAAVRLPDGYAVRRLPQTGGALGVDLPVRRHQDDAERRHNEKRAARLQGVVRFLRAFANGSTTGSQNGGESSVFDLGGDGRALREPEAPWVEALRRTGHYRLRTVALQLREFLGRYGPDVSAWVDAGARGQREGLLAGQLRVGYATPAAQQYASEHVHRHAARSHDFGRRIACIWRRLLDVALPTQRRVEHRSYAQPVYDILNCGPRSRFVVAGIDGLPLIVHNCTQPKRNQYHRVDARDVRLSNKAQIQAWVEDYGEDSDFVRVRVKGMFPRAGYANFISPGLVTDARRRRIELRAYQAYPKYLSCDPARFGDDFTVITLRQGLKVHWQVKMGGYDGHQVAARLWEMLTGDVAKPRHERKDALGAVALAYDANGNGADLDTALRNMQNAGKLTGVTLIPVMWGVPAKDDEHYFNQRSECWGKMRDFLEHGEIPDDDDLANELTSLDYGYDARFRIQLESKKNIKKNGGKSPDAADSLALSFIPDLIDRKVTTAKAKPVQRRQVVWTRQ